MRKNNGFYQKIGYQVAALRKALEVKQEYVEVAAGHGHDWMSQTENGKRPLTVKDIFDIANALEVHPLIMMVCVLKGAGAFGNVIAPVKVVLDTVYGNAIDDILHRRENAAKLRTNRSDHA